MSPRRDPFLAPVVEKRPAPPADRDDATDPPNKRRAGREGVAPLPSPLVPGLRPDDEEDVQAAATPINDEQGAAVGSKQAALDWLRRQPEANTRNKKGDSLTLAQLKQMVQTASAIGGPKVLAAWRTVLWMWRDEGKVNWGRAVDVVEPQDYSAIRTARPWLNTIGEDDQRTVVEFAALYERRCRKQVTDFLQSVIDWRGHAALYRCYLKIQERTIKLRQTCGSDGLRVNEVMKDLAFYGLYGPVGGERKGELWRQFANQLSRAKRWWMIEEHFGPGGLTLFHRDTITKTYIEQILSEPRLRLWLQLIDYVRPNVAETGKALLPLFLDACRGRPPPTQTLRVEITKEDEMDKRLAPGTGWFHGVDAEEAILETQPSLSDWLSPLPHCSDECEYLTDFGDFPSSIIDGDEFGSHAM